MSVVTAKAEKAAQVVRKKATKAKQEFSNMANAETIAAETAQGASAAAENIRSNFTGVNEQARAAVEKGTRMIEELTDFQKGNVEAFVAAGRAAAKGAETLTQNAADFSRRSFEEATRAMKTLTAAKSPTEFFKLQSDIARTQFDAMIAETSRVSETMVKIFGDVTEPLSSRMAVAADKMKVAVK